MLTMMLTMMIMVYVRCVLVFVFSRWTEPSKALKWCWKGFLRTNLQSIYNWFQVLKLAYKCKQWSSRNRLHYLKQSNLFLTFYFTITVLLLRNFEFIFSQEASWLPSPFSCVYLATLDHVQLVVQQNVPIHDRPGWHRWKWAAGWWARWTTSNQSLPRRWRSSAAPSQHRSD